MVYFGKNIERNETEDRWYFQDAESYALHGAYPDFADSAEDEREVELYTFRDMDLEHVKNLQAMYEELADCLRRRKEDP